MCIVMTRTRSPLLVVFNIAPAGGKATTAVSDGFVLQAGVEQLRPSDALDVGQRLQPAELGDLGGAARLPLQLLRVRVDDVPCVKQPPATREEANTS